ncbi:MAG: indolepyruvate ferredoxin oxidoreductase subunit alpha, partial [Desulfovibrio sp.]|nr:indolepyruvate ferredoxin oxidoreductase subunit alpha [Desulfovibrio sp.]
VLSHVARPEQGEFKRDPGRFVPAPMVARKRHLALEAQMRRAAALSEESVFNKSRFPDGSFEFGIIASGAARDYLHDALRLSNLADETAVLELGMTWPLPKNKIVAFLSRCRNVLVLEEGDPILERDIRAIAQEAGATTNISGKDAKLTSQSEYSTSLVRERILRWMGKAEKSPARQTGKNLPGRPPILCPGCAHRTIYYAARKVFGDDVYYSNDIGCYTLGAAPPLRGADFMICMGSSVSAGSGFSRASKKPVVGFIGDSTFFHSGMTGLLNAVFNKHDLLLVIMDNGSTAMTGHQPNPGVVQEVLGEHAEHLDIESVVRGLGVKVCEKVRGGQLPDLLKAMRRLKDLDGTRVLIAQEPCALFARRTLKKGKNIVATVKAQGEEADKCMRELGCPAFYRKNGELRVDNNLCSGCLVCVQIAPKHFGAVKKSDES